jgi:hypothetical protein
LIDTKSDEILLIPIMIKYYNSKEENILWKQQTS